MIFSYVSLLPSKWIYWNKMLFFFGAYKVSSLFLLVPFTIEYLVIKKIES